MTHSRPRWAQLTNLKINIKIQSREQLFPPVLNEFNCFLAYKLYQYKQTPERCEILQKKSWRDYIPTGLGMDKHSNNNRYYRSYRISARSNYREVVLLMYVFALIKAEFQPDEFGERSIDPSTWSFGSLKAVRLHLCSPFKSSMFACLLIWFLARLFPQRSIDWFNQPLNSQQWKRYVVLIDRNRLTRSFSSLKPAKLHLYSPIKSGASPCASPCELEICLLGLLRCCLLCLLVALCAINWSI